MAQRCYIQNPTSYFYQKSGRITSQSDSHVSVDFGQGAFRFLPFEVAFDWNVKKRVGGLVVLKQNSSGAKVTVREKDFQRVLDKLNSE